MSFDARKFPRADKADVALLLEMIDIRRLRTRAFELGRDLGRISDLAGAAIKRGALLDRQELTVNVALDLGACVENNLGA